ncbi:death-associated inhibitor of apoptosis 1-like [Tetranychus urticae]|uniref:death-associated inhibitor of apoptosis 1-like n=1 Tax=Tetranychus urticae TaxID=32264 RepID=UPI00077BF132|nr:death-associated inhibitor of apoptosis 1-like [Tetranychus urticae]
MDNSDFNRNPNISVIVSGRARGRIVSQRYHPNGSDPLLPPFEFRRQRNYRPLYRDYWTLSSRIRSYNLPSRPPFPSDINVTSLAEAGFYYTGFADGTVCYSCGVLWDMWTANDDPWVRHAHLSPKCYHIYLHRGSNFGETISNNRSSVEEAIRRSNGDDDRHKCKICYENEVNVVFSPCEHAIACSDCASKLQQLHGNSNCPFCRTPLTNIARLRFVD